MTLIEEAARQLNNTLRSHRWFFAVGVGVNEGKPALFVYVTRKKGLGLPLAKEFNGFPVVTRKTGRPRIGDNPR